LFLFRVSLIRFRVLNFSSSYIISDKNFIRFHFLLITFILRIYFLIISPNLVSILLGWDGLGISSYLLVIYYGRSKAYNSGIITAITNRLGDSLILISIGYLIAIRNWSIIFYRRKTFSWRLILIIIVAASTKRAQIPFSAWLPAAIAAPTPVSSLVHSSTLVTAGVYLLIRHNNFFAINNVTFYIIVIGCLTMTIARVSALFETDLKKIVALSTLRQLGVIFLGLRLGRFIIRYFHLLTHAFFKALLFLCTGAIIHRRKDYQDLRITGSSLISLPTINRFILISRFSLIGLPFISAFFSKEIILEFIILNNFNFFVYIFIILGISLTTLYRIRFILLVFSFWNLNNLLIYKSEEDFSIILRILILIIPASLRGSWLCLFLFDRIKLYESFFIDKIFVTIIILLRIIYFSFKTPKINKWGFLLWRLRRIWILPFIRRQIINFIRFCRGWKIFKLSDRGRIKIYSLYLRNNNFLDYGTFSIKLVHKFLFIILIWTSLFLIIYLCK